MKLQHIITLTSTIKQRETPKQCLGLCLDSYVQLDQIRQIWSNIEDYGAIANMSDEQIRLARRFVSGFIYETDATFGTVH
jgi:hypothetical protein